jgi:hypothetical protein
MTNKINNIQIVNSIELKQNKLNLILKQSRKLTSIDKFYDFIVKELNIFNIHRLDIKKIVISKVFLDKIKESDDFSKNDIEYSKYLPISSKEIDNEDFTIYLLENYI